MSPPSRPDSGPAVDAEARHWPVWLVVPVVVVAYAAGALLTFGAIGADAILLLFLPAGVTLSALVLSPRRYWPWILTAVALTEIAVDLSQGHDLAFVWGFALANTAEPLVGALLLRRYLTGEVDLLRRRDLVAFIVCCVVVGPLVGGLFGATTISLGLQRDWLESFFPFWAGDAMGVLTVGGLVLVWRHRPRISSAAAARWGLALLATVAVTAVGFWSTHLPLFYLPIPLLFWFAFTQPLVVTVSSGLAMTVTANWMTSARQGPWADLTGPTPLKTATLELFLGIAVQGAWFLAVGVAERDSARSATSAERAARQRLNALQTLTAQLAKAATSTAIAEAIVRDGIRLVGDHGIAAVVSPDGTEVLAWTSDDRPAGVVERYRRIPLHAETPLTRTARTGTLVISQTPDDMLILFPDLADTYRALDLHSGLFVPVSDGDGAVLGALAFGFTRENAIDADVIAFAEALASLTGQALRRARLYERELDAAHQLQRALLPVLSGGLSGIHVTADYRPADLTRDVGGDWYDVFELPGGRIGFAVGDVVGHDLAAAAAMARLQSALRILAHSAHDPGRVLDELDRASTLISNSRMTTVGYADYDPATRLLRYACAGHPPPLLITGVEAEYLWDGRSVPVGVHQPARGHGERVVPEGSTLIWYTDGLVERRDQPLRASLDRLAAMATTLNQQDPDGLCQALLHRIAHVGTMRDDTVVLCVRFMAVPAASPATATQDTSMASNDGAGPRRSNARLPHDPTYTPVP
jgi:serine phosphatase RsbU (regulator of sigma subunit)/integral membrane sensor domain MASE1